MTEAAPAPSPATPGPASNETSGVRVPPPLYFVAGFLVGLAIELAVPIGDLPTAVAIAGAVLGFAAWLALDGGAMLRFNRAGTSMMPIKPSTVLVTQGPYRYTRNPMYLGMACAYAGFAFAFQLVWPLIVLPLVIAAVDRLVIAKEEAYLSRRFGEPYREYLGGTRRWL